MPAGKNDWFWYELLTPDPEAAAKFYSSVVGWKITEYPKTEGVARYLVANIGERGVAGIMGMPPDVPVGVPAHWTGYLHTDDTDAMAKQVAEAGGSVCHGPMDIPTVGRFAVLADPEGGTFNAMKPFPQQDVPSLPMDTPGNVSWSELHSDDPERNFAWYERLFGWKRGEAMDMGKGGTYQMFSTNDQPVTGGFCGKMGGQMPTHWLYYFYVAGIDAAIERVKQSGGTVFMGPHQVPGDSWIALGKDPQGGTFALHSLAR